MRSFNQAVSYLQIIKSKKYQRRGFAAMIILLGLVLITPNLAVITGGELMSLINLIDLNRKLRFRLMRESGLRIREGESR